MENRHANKPIDRFSGKYGWLSNFTPCPVSLPEDTPPIIYPSVEHAYQAAKSSERGVRVWVCNSKSPAEAKARGRRIALAGTRPEILARAEEWDRRKEEVMLGLLRQKFSAEPFLSLLLESSGRMLIEGNNWGDRYWGVCRGEGKNRLGVLIMKVREELEVGHLVKGEEHEPQK